MINDTKKVNVGETFDVAYPKHLIIANQTVGGEYPLVSQSSRNNGICKYIDKPNSWDPEPGRCITVAVDTQEVFYQNDPFYTTKDIFIIRDKHFNVYNGCYIVNVIKQYVKFKFDYGYKSSIKRVKALNIPLPVTPDGDLNWAYMERVSRDLFIKEFRQRLEKGEKALADIGEVKELMEPDHYGKVNFKTLFPKVIRGRSLVRKHDRVPGDIPYVSATKLNNGIDCYLSNPDNLPTYKDCLTMAIVGGPKSTFYQEKEFMASPNVVILKNDSFNKYIYLYLIAWLNQVSELFSYGYEIAPYRLENKNVELPMTSDDKIDFDYMETTVKRLMIEAYEKNINICKSKLEELHG